MKEFIKKLKKSFATYSKVKKFFKIPKCYIQIWNIIERGGLVGRFCIDESDERKIKIFSHDVLWKDKGGYPSFESDPALTIILFNKYQILFQWGHNWEMDDMYWETIIDMVYYGKDLKESIENNTWTGMNKLKSNVEICNLLTRKGRKTLKELREVKK